MVTSPKEMLLVLSARISVGNGLQWMELPQSKDSRELLSTLDPALLTLAGAKVGAESFKETLKSKERSWFVIVAREADFVSFVIILCGCFVVVVQIGMPLLRGVCNCTVPYNYPLNYCSTHSVGSGRIQEGVTIDYANSPKNLN
jgi:hypothetical protein